jgi:hypothetical protein
MIPRLSIWERRVGAFGAVVTLVLLVAPAIRL